MRRSDRHIWRMTIILNTTFLQIHLDNSLPVRTLPHSSSGGYYEDSGAHASQSLTGARGNTRAAHHPPYCRLGGEPPCSSVRELSVATAVISA